MAEQVIVLDEENMEQKIRELPDQLEKAWTNLWIKDVAEPKQAVNKVLICGMGGSGIAGSLAQELFSDSKVIIETWSDYGLPNWVDQSTAVIAVSYSGDTEEVVDSAKKALEIGASLYAISAGGKMKELSEIHGFPLVHIDYKSHPRAAIGWLYGSLITLLTKLKVVTFNEADYFQAIEELRHALKKDSFINKAEELAIQLNNKVPLILTSSPLSSVARRWVSQLNENSKTLALSGSLPEICHNLVVGVDFPIPEKLSILILESKYAFSRNIARKKIVEKIFANKDIPAMPLSVSSKNLLAEQLILIHFGDWLSFYLAGVYGVDPSPVEPITFLKEELKKV